MSRRHKNREAEQRQINFRLYNELLLYPQTPPIIDLVSNLEGYLDPRPDKLQTFFATAPTEIRHQVLKDVLLPVPVYTVPSSHTKIEETCASFKQLIETRKTCVALLQAGNRQLYLDVLEVLKAVHIELWMILRDFPEPARTQWRKMYWSNWYLPLQPSHRHRNRVACFVEFNPGGGFWFEVVIPMWMTEDDAHGTPQELQ